MNKKEREKVWRIFWRKKGYEVGIALAILAVIFGILMLAFDIGTWIPVCGWEYKSMQTNNNCVGFDIDCSCAGTGFYFLNTGIGLGILLALFLIIMLIVTWLQYNWEEAKEEAKVK